MTEEQRKRKNEQQRERYANNKERESKRQIEYRKRTKEKTSEYGKAYREKNKEILKVKQKAYREKHKEKLAALAKEFYKKNKDRLNKNNKENHRKRMLKRGPLAPVKLGTYNYYKITEEIEVRRNKKSKGFEMQHPGQKWLRITINYIYEQNWQILVDMPKVRLSSSNRGCRAGTKKKVNTSKMGLEYPSELKSACVTGEGFKFKDIRTNQIVVIPDLNCDLTHLEPVR